MQGLLQTAEEKKQASMTELSAKHQKVIYFKCPDYKFFFITKIGWHLCAFILYKVRLNFTLFIFFHQNIQNLEGQIADALADRNKAAETISKLQVRLLLL